MTTRKLRLGPLPKTESTKLTFACPASLKADLDRYAAVHAQAYGEAVDAVTLIPHMLEAFIAGDRDSGKTRPLLARSRRCGTHPRSSSACRCRVSTGVFT